MSRIEGLDKLANQLKNYGHRLAPAASKLAVEYVLREMANYVKDNGPWVDRTGNLRNSIDFKIDPKDPKGVLFAGMEYAIHVERKEGYWVLSGAVEWVAPILPKLFGDQYRISTQMPRWSR